MLETLHFLDAAERDFVRDALACVEGAAPAEAMPLVANLERLGHAAELVEITPSIAASWETRRLIPSSGETLLDLLCTVPEWDLDLHVPMRVIFGQAYLVAKINFFKSTKYALDAARAPAALLERAEQELGQSIYSKLAEELFISIVTDATQQRPVKAAAARSLFDIWEHRLEREIDDFAPVLESVWSARNRVRPVIGTTLGTHEFFRLLHECSDTRFFEHFEGAVPDEQLQAFEEFLFGLSWEEISRIREHMMEADRSVISSEEARAALSKPPSWTPRASGPQALYTSYKKRRVKAQYRMLTGAPGPRKTAESFVMTAFLSRDGRAA